MKTLSPLASLALQGNTKTRLDLHLVCNVLQVSTAAQDQHNAPRAHLDHIVVRGQANVFYALQEHLMMHTTEPNVLHALAVNTAVLVP